MYEDSQLMLWSEATPANHSAKPVEKLGIMTSATCGPRCTELSESASPLGLLRRMLQTTLPSDSMRSLMTWKVSATPAKRIYYRLVPSLPRIKESGFLLLPTPRASHGMTGQLRSAESVRRSAKGHNSRLEDYVALIEDFPVGQRGYLNPEWLEWLMGLPVGWTELSSSGTQ